MVRAIFAAFDSENFSLARLCEYLNERKLLRSSGKPWNPGGLRKFLLQPFFYGRFVHRGAVHDGTHEPYFSIEDFERRSRFLSERRSGLVQRQNRHPLACMIRCPDCGRHFIKEFFHRSRDRAPYVYFKHCCPGKKKETRFREAEVWAMIDDAIEATRFSPAFGEFLKAEFEKPLAQKRRRNRKEKQALAARIEKLKAQKTRLLDLFTLEEISQQELLERRRSYESQIDLLHQQREAIDLDGGTVLAEIAASVDSLRQIPESYFATTDPDEKVTILKNTASGLIFDPAGSLRIDWLKPYNILMNCPAVQKAIEVDRIEGAEEKVSDSVSLADTGSTKIEKTLSDVQQMMIDFKFWLAERK